MKKNLFYYLTISVLLLTACKKDKPPQTVASYPTYPPSLLKLNPTALEFVQLPVNRYFIYKDSTTGSTDTVRVLQSSIETKFQPGIPPYVVSGWYSYGGYDCYFEKFTLRLSKITGTYQDWFMSVVSAEGNGRTILSEYAPVMIDSLFTFHNGNSNLSALWYPFSNRGIMLYKNIPNLTIEGTMYTDVYKFNESNGLQPNEVNYQEITHYWVKGIGIIKKEIRAYNSVKTSLLVKYW